MLRWIDDVSKFAAPNVIKLLIGTKCDLEEQRAVSAEDAELLQRANGKKIFYTFYIYLKITFN